MSLTHTEPTRLSAVIFSCKTTLLKARRAVVDLSSSQLKRHKRIQSSLELPIVSHSHSALWSHDNPAETTLTAGKVQNLRIACRALNLTYIPAGETFSFWKQIGRTTKTKGYVTGRELREGCIIPTLGGGLCQLSNALYDAALKTGSRIIERHAHSQVIPGSLSELNRDATVYWNYVDLRFTTSFDLLIEAKLTKDQLIITFRGTPPGPLKESKPEKQESPQIPIGNCYSCNVTSCFRNAPQTPDAIRFGKTAALVDAVTPEFKKYIMQRLNQGDHLLSPISTRFFPSYLWSAPKNVAVKQCPLTAIKKAIQLRRIPKQGKALQETLLRYDRLLAESYAKKLDYSVSHLIISINLLPHLWEAGVLGGRTFDVLAHRSPISKIQEQLNQAHLLHPQSTTLTDFRAVEKYLKLEQEALLHANRIISPHSYICGQFENHQQLDWIAPAPQPVTVRTNSRKKIFFPASALGRKGIYELVEALKDKDIELLILGNADEGSSCPLGKFNWRKASISDMADCDLVILPAHVEHSPRPLLRALSLGIQVIATKACGLPEQKNLMLLDSPDDLVREIDKFLI
ncbi:VanW like protein [Rubritalea squalenifaciens DSM 18772]|uniref:VanW like protein n=1 Tax=Rubritalea squalenifaciens DSM 18772 TaxID=1123071 RepID=A0A1M6HT41_9BACT|nr:VanW family protein [Rubritalea squalenifaciens]SHJ25365.1 VanW like protein [Rubritalea squalenifaciens DSM 18772]